MDEKIVWFADVSVDMIMMSVVLMGVSQPLHTISAVSFCYVKWFQSAGISGSF